jgi:hypothetical protein
MAKQKVDDDDGKKDSFIVYKEWGMLISSLCDADRLKFFDLLMGWDFIAIPTVDSRHLQSIVSFVFGKISENREKYLDKCKTNSAAAKARWDEYKRLKALAMQTDANAYERTQTHENAMLNENGNEHEHVNDNRNEHDNDIPSKEVVRESVPFSGFDACKASREFEAIYKKAGRRNAIEREYVQALQKINAQYGYDGPKAHEAIKTSAAAYMAYSLKAKTEARYLPNPETWLSERMYETNWLQKAKELVIETPQGEQKSKPLLGTKLIDELEKAREERHRKQREEEGANNGK